MTVATLTLAVVSLVVLAKLWAADRRWHLRESEFAQERREWVKERQELNNRIQAPETAVAQVIAQSGPDGMLHVPIYDDQAFLDEQEAMTGGG